MPRHVQIQWRRKVEVRAYHPHGDHSGDAACWPAGAANAHQVVNRSDAPCTYLILGTRVTHDICHYPDVGKILYTEGDTWRLTRDDGTLIKSGKV